ncbi:MAG: heme ABC exporter ATP-binding protein CcmA [Alphaproteobacteria bacterium]|nr:heme ABC exporter ATP-binding protein CcmA [Alphaproteobacteria bacterium]
MLLEAEGLVGGRGGHPLFGPLSLALAAGGALKVTGPNGAGKSTLLRLFAGLLVPMGGVVRANAALRYLGHHDAVKPAMTVFENLVFWRRFYGSDAAAAALVEVGLDRLAATPARYLSAGQRRRLALARALDPAAPIWLLDEPTNGLDADSVGRLEAALARHRSAGGATIVATHASLALPEATMLELGLT